MAYCKLLSFQNQPPEGFCKNKVFLEISQNSLENIFLNRVAGLNFIKKETLAQIFFCEFC